MPLHWCRHVDVAPKFYPVLSSFPGLDLPCWACDTESDDAVERGERNVLLDNILRLAVAVGVSLAVLMVQQDP